MLNKCFKLAYKLLVLICSDMHITLFNFLLLFSNLLIMIQRIVFLEDLKVFALTCDFYFADMYILHIF